MRAEVIYWLGSDLRAIELIAARYDALRFAPHWHAGYSIGVVTQNRLAFRMEDRTWFIGPGDFVVLRPGQVHDGLPLHPGGWASRMAYVPPETFAALIGLSRAATDSLLFPTPVFHAPELCKLFLEWHQAAQQGARIHGALLTEELFRSVRELGYRATSRCQAVGVFDATHELLLHVQALVAEQRLAAPSLAEYFDRSLTTSWRRVRKVFGLPPKRLLGHVQVMTAKHMLAGGAAVLEAAMDCGYHDQAHFSRKFVATYGVTPGQYRRAHCDRN
jgi:AraC-like DNA-binding protein